MVFAHGSRVVGDEVAIFDLIYRIALTLDYPEQAKNIAGLLRTRGTTDSALIREIIESEASALREGTL